jgi:hypothetical protein
MRIREENCNMVLLGAVTAFSLAVAGIVYVAEPEPGPVPQAVVNQAEAMKPVQVVADQSPVRVIGTPFVPNTNPRER